MKLSHSLPLDCASVPGMVMVIGSILAHPSLNPEAITTARKTLLALEEHAALRQLSWPMSNQGAVTLESNSDGKFSLTELKTTLGRNIGLSFSRLLVAAKSFENQLRLK